MNRLTLTNGMDSYDIIIQKYKLIIGNNLEAKHKIKQIIKLYFNTTESEYRKENDVHALIKVDGDLIQQKRTTYYDVNSAYSIIEDSKMGSKSLILKYFEKKLEKQELFDSINTVDILMDSIAQELSEEYGLQTQFVKMTVKQLLKLMKPFYFNELQRDEYDLTQEELILFQLRIIEGIQKNNLSENCIVLLDCPKISHAILDQVGKIKNSWTLIITNSYLPSIEINDIALAENTLIDFANENYIYELFGEIKGERKTITEVKTMLKEYITEKYTYTKHEIINDIKEYSQLR